MSERATKMGLVVVVVVGPTKPVEMKFSVSGMPISGLPHL